MLRTFKFLVVSGILFFSLGFSATYASANQSASSKSISELWDEVEELSGEAIIISKDDEASTRAVSYLKWGKGTMSLSAAGTYAIADVEPAAYPVSRITATGKTVRDHKLGTSAVVTLLMRDGRELGRKNSSATISKTSTANVNTYPGSVLPKTEYRSHGTHTITKGLTQSLGYTGESLKF